MSKRSYIARYSLIIKKLRHGAHISFAEMKEYIENETESLRLNDDDLEIAFSQRTFQRDIKEIKNLFGIEIEYSRTNGGYFIADRETVNPNFQRMIEVYDVLNILNMSDDLKNVVTFEKRSSLGTENFYGIIHAIKNRNYIEFNYTKFTDDKQTTRKVKPLGLKESQGRWYLISEEGETKIKTFGLDRISHLDILRHRFAGAAKIDLDKMFQNSFGVIGSSNKPVEVILSFSAFQSNYVKTLPLHASQEIIFENKKEMQARYLIDITPDFVMEILRLGDEVKVIKPLSLQKEIIQSMKNALKKYE